MNLDDIQDLAAKDNDEVNRYIVDFTLIPGHLTEYADLAVSLTWSSVKYGAEEVDQVPNDKRGLYAFAVCLPSESLPPHGYILYVGMAGRDSARSLRERYRDYLIPSKIVKRHTIIRMIGNWRSVLRFFYAPVEDDVSSEDLKEMERQLNTAFMPPFSLNDLKAGVAARRRAFP